MNRFAYDNIDPRVTPARREIALKRRLGGPGTRRKNKLLFDAKNPALTRKPAK